MSVFQGLKKNQKGNPAGDGAAESEKTSVATPDVSDALAAIEKAKVEPKVETHEEKLQRLMKKARAGCCLG